MRSRLMVFAVVAVALVLLHLRLLEIPFFWDELGQFVPGALDLYGRGAWIPQSVTPNSHPPLLMAYLAAVWQVVGFSIESTRVAMLLVAALGVTLTFLLAIRLSRSLPGRPAFWPPVLLALSPLFFTQAVMAQLDMPAMVLTVLALYLFLEGRTAASVAACTALVLTKETSVVVPLVFAAWLYREGYRKRALLFLLPLIPLAGWLALVAARTGTPFGTRDFAEYNLAYPLHPVRLAVALLRRAYALFLADFHWAGVAAVALAWKPLAEALRPLRREWTVTALVAAAQVAVVTVLGGATLERYLLPVWPLLYIAVAAAWAVLGKRRRLALQLVLMAGLIAANFFSSPLWAFPWENNLSMVTFARLQQKASDVVETSFQGHTITTCWPLSSALRRPELGYVLRPRPVAEIRDFSESTIRRLEAADVDVLIVYSRDPQPVWGGMFDGFRRRFYGYRQPMPLEAIAGRLNLGLVARWEANGQWIAILQRDVPVERPAGEVVRRMRLPAPSTLMAQRGGTSVVEP